MISIINSDIANISSVKYALNRLKIQSTITTDPKDLLKSNGIILPGVGAFSDGMKSLASHGLVTVLRELASQKKPILGICLGMQLLAEQSEEFGLHEGLGLIPGRVVLLNPKSKADLVPNMGWCEVHSDDPILFEDIPSQSSYYFVHSYHFVPRVPNSSIATIQFANDSICVGIRKENIFGVQFHPEKSQDVGLHLLENFCKFTLNRE